MRAQDQKKKPPKPFDRPRKAYAPPRLTQYGSLARLIRKSGATIDGVGTKMGA